ncbi:hypothetical protein Tco_0729172 [Tanacetum coccineum]|uniref:Uncharacterized protein n=1 Tax=Tanacetum coccineum TaxID=301880 RepID=A0ABQ4YQJ7_9ASTR
MARIVRRPINTGIFKLYGSPFLILGSRVEKGGQKISESEDWLVILLMVLKRRKSIVCLIVNSLFIRAVNLASVLSRDSRGKDPKVDDGFAFSIVKSGIVDENYE